MIEGIRSNICKNKNLIVQISVLYMWVNNSHTSFSLNNHMITELLGNHNYVLYSPICNFPPYHQYTDNMNQNMYHQ